MSPRRKESSDDEIIYLYLPKAVGILFLLVAVLIVIRVGSTGMVYCRLAGTNPVDLTDEPPLGMHLLYVTTA
jgi:hypothetical protein